MTEVRPVEATYRPATASILEQYACTRVIEQYICTRAKIRSKVVNGHIQTRYRLYTRTVNDRGKAGRAHVLAPS